MLPLKYTALIGSGGVGTGSFFLLDGDHTLGREESRAGRFLDRRDYCKLHIIAHYLKTLLGPSFTAIPISRVGADEAGRRLRAEMQTAGLDLSYLAEDPARPTLFSFCFLYPDGSGGNLTTADSAAAAVEPSEIFAAAPEFARFSMRGIALAVPEAPPAARSALLQLGTRHGFFRVVSLTTAEAASSWAADQLHEADLAALNFEEAACLAGLTLDPPVPPRQVTAVVSTLRVLYPHLSLSITAGRHGSWSWDGRHLHHLPAFSVPVVNTAGAGDAHLSGLLAGLSWGLSLPLAQEVGTLVAAQSVTSPHTIHPAVHPAGLFAFARQVQAPISAPVEHLLALLARSDP